MNGRFLREHGLDVGLAVLEDEAAGLEPTALPAVVVPPTAAPEPPSSSIV